MWATPLALVFIDGGHAYETVLTDYTLLSRHVIKGGYLLMHDIFPNPADGGQAPYQIYQTALNSGLFKAFPTQKSLGILQRL
jgi:cephalosporin hydroxylase